MAVAMEPGISMVDKHAHQRRGRANGNRRSRDILGHAFREAVRLVGDTDTRSGKCEAGTKSDSENKGMDKRLKEAHLCRSKAISLKKKCKRMVRHVCSVALNSSVDWPMSMTRRIFRSKKKEEEDGKRTAPAQAA